MAYRILPTQLQVTADGVREFFKTEWGIGTSRLEVEVPIAKEVGYVTTFRAVMDDFYLRCVEVSTRVYIPILDSVVLDCKNNGIPLKLYVAVPKNGTEGNFKSDMSRARANGVGIIEIDDDGGALVQDALALSLTGLRPVYPKDFPAAYRQSISEALKLFHSGSPSKACSIVYDEIEALSRKLARRAVKEVWWRGLPAGVNSPKLNADKDSWHSIMLALVKHYDANASGCPKLKDALFARILGVTEHRNESGHKPKTVAQVKKRDSELRTRFESALDMLLDLSEAMRPLRLR